MATLVLAATVTLGVAWAAQDKPKYTISDVMLKAHKGGLLKKVASGKADKKEKEALVELYTALTMNKPPMGDEKSFKDKANVMLDAARAASKDEKDAMAKLAKAAKSCKACHDAHRE
jgi:hypothetical protein